VAQSTPAGSIARRRFFARRFCDHYMRTLPAYGLIGLLAIVVSQAGVFARVAPFYHWHTPIAWTGFILFADAVVWKRRGNSWIRNNPAELFFAACVSVPLWVLFELYNKYSLHNWYYVGLPDLLLLRYFGYVWSFATILPAIFETAELVGSSRDRRAPRDRVAPAARQPLGVGAWLSIVIGAVMVAVPIFVHSTYLAAPVWLGFILLVDPLNARAGHESITGDLSRGHRGRLVNLMIAGLLCGVLWELWNYWGGTKWIYNVPILPEIKIFEMPILGFGGFPPFAVACFAMYVAIRRLFWQAVPRPVGW
jgi:hypothetical protein